MSMAERKTMTRAVKNPVKRKLTRAEKKEIAAVIQAAKGDGKPHTAQQTIPKRARGLSFTGMWCCRSLTASRRTPSFTVCLRQSRRK